MVRRKTHILWIAVLLALLSGCGNRESTQPEETLQTTEAVMAEETTMPAVSDQPQVEERIMPVLKEPAASDFVAVTDYLPEVRQELRYATENNFTGQRIYEFSECYLRYGTVRKLMQVSAELMQQGLYLKIWDGFRPVSAQYVLWEVCPDPNFVANPNVGFSSHSRGNTVDITLVYEDGTEAEMPSAFDDFSASADRDYSDCTETATANAKLLESVMEKYGFSGYWGEWWHFSDSMKYDVESVFDPSVISWWYANCEEYITLRQQPDINSEEILRINAGREMQVLGYTGDFAMVDYEGYRGYVLKDYIRYNDFQK